MARPRSNSEKYLRITDHGHARASKNGQRLAHVAIAEQALGHALPPKAKVHHVNGDKRDNETSNLVICEDTQYHSLLHMRERILSVGGDPDTDRVCYTCGEAKPLDMFYPQPALPNRYVSGRCKPCQAAYDKQRHYDKQCAIAA